MGWVSPQEINFVSLPTAVFCVQCEFISENRTSNCLFCGSQALLSLSRVLGGSLRNQQTAHLISDAELDRLVRELLRTVPSSITADHERHTSTSFAAHAPARHHARAMSATADCSMQPGLFPEPNVPSRSIELEPAIHVIAERAQALTRATGAAIALRKGNEMVCRARTGRTAPDLGIRLQLESGISAQCVRTGEVVLCNDAETNPHVDLATCQHLGVRSILAAPLRHFRRTLGIFEVLSPTPYAFNGQDVATMQLLSGLMVAAISRLSDMRRVAEKHSA
jgi:GAF domain-containing protein